MNKGNGRWSTMKNKALYKPKEQFEKRHSKAKQEYLDRI
jgi:hypothetical protein